MSKDEQQSSASKACKKFTDPNVTANGKQRATVALTQLRTLWFNTGSLCNIACQNCYMESTPKNDSLAYLSTRDVEKFLDEARAENLPIEEIAFTGGEPFMNKALIAMLQLSLSRGYRVLVLTNAMKPMHHRFQELLKLKQIYRESVAIRVSIDHYSRSKHEAIRGADTWEPMLKGLQWLSKNDFNLAIAGRTCWNESEVQVRRGYAALFEAENIPINTKIPTSLVLFPEMDNQFDVPEITNHCWDILGVAPEKMMCATSRMVIKRKGSFELLVVPCTLLPYDPKFELGHDLGGSSKNVHLNHPHCAKFCVLGGASCSV
jgi:sulfatase maturation enzyme AslB (radical SAM superfamily)